MTPKVEIVIESLKKGNGISETKNGIENLDKTTKRASTNISHTMHQMHREIGFAIGLSVGMAYEFNKTLDEMQKKLEDIGATDSAKGIEDAQVAWTALGDTLVGMVADSGVIDMLSNGLKTAADMAWNIVLFFRLGILEQEKLLGIITEEERKKQRLEITQQSLLDKENSVTRAKKDQTKELQKQLDLESNLEDALFARDPRAIAKAQAALAGAQPINRNINQTGAGGQVVTINVKGDGVVSDVLKQAFLDARHEEQGATTWTALGRFGQ